METIKFYNLRAKASVEIPLAQVTKLVTKRKLKSGAEQDRYQLKATSPEGMPLFKFVSKATFDAIPG